MGRLITMSVWWGKWFRSWFFHQRFSEKNNRNLETNYNVSSGWGESSSQVKFPIYLSCLRFNLFMWTSDYLQKVHWNFDITHKLPRYFINPNPLWHDNECDKMEREKVDRCSDSSELWSLHKQLLLSPLTARRRWETLSVISAMLLLKQWEKGFRENLLRSLIKNSRRKLIALCLECN